MPSYHALRLQVTSTSNSNRSLIKAYEPRTRNDTFRASGRQPALMCDLAERFAAGLLAIWSLAARPFSGWFHGWSGVDLLQ
ncbi:hypothetical protein K439DRAFT_1638998 [Ramaria rubella]|nr:hypothetical protein K439DRAFT_1640864 [Ramaria rubella]KAF8578260.1 hypothetical protein K439DRAFT_1638998 [Ramaria rubella]